MGDRHSPSDSPVIAGRRIPATLFPGRSGTFAPSFRAMSSESGRQTGLDIGIEIGDLLRPHRAGVARYTQCLVDGLAVRIAPHSVTAWAPWRRGVGWHRRPAAVPLRLFGGLPPWSRPDLFHATACVFPVWRSRIEIATVHDLYAIRPSQNLPADEVRRLVDYVLRAERVICVSRFTMRHVLELLGIPQERCVAIPLAVGPAFAPATEVRKSALRKAKNLPQEFFLFVGRDRPNKNLDRLVAAYARSQLSMPLIIAGRQRLRSRRRLLTVARNHACSGSIRWLTNVGDHDLPMLLSCATALCMPSTFEGFGLPIVEAMACGTPVVTSAGRATEEAAGGKAILVDPESIDSLADGLLRVQHVSSMDRDAARAFATRRSWDDVARETLAVYLA